MKNRTTLEYLELAETMGVNPEESYLIALLDKIDGALEDTSTAPDLRVRLMVKKAQLKVDLEELRNNPNKKLVYIMTDGAALPIFLSKNVDTLKEKGLIDNTITIGKFKQDYIAVFGE